MGLFGKSKAQQELDDASHAISSIFAPNQVPYTASSLTSSTASRGTDDKVYLFAPPPSATTSEKAWWQFWRSAPVTDASPTNALTPPPPPPRPPRACDSAITTRWQELPPCPIQGYDLTRQGLIDTLAKPKPHVLTTPEVRTLLVELAGLEQRAKYTVDSQFAGTIGSRGHRGLELFVNPCLFLTGVYLMTWKTAKLYREAVPRQSVLLTRCLSLLRWSLPAAEQERVAQQHRRLMQATNARVTLSFLTGLFVFSVAIWTRPDLDVMETAPEVVQAKRTVAYQQHSERALKWLWFVYYHHPVYAREAKSLLTPAIAIAAP